MVNLVKCSVCNRKSVYYRPYSGERLCKKCFIASIERRVQHTISENKMFKPDDRIALALSGGKDSTSLLHMLSSIESNFPKAELIAITIDEGVSGYRPESIRIAKKNCDKLGIKHHVYSFKELYGYTLD
jgi:tRNA(Ile)-lysidine synthase TilS/MesJ